MTGTPGEPQEPSPATLAGDPAALGELWRRHRRWIASVLTAHGARPGELEDMLQEVALTVVEKVGTVREAGALRAWLRTVAANTARQAARGQDRRDRRVEPFDGEQVDPRSGRELSRSADRSDLAQLVEWVRELPLEQREPLLMKSLGAMSQRDIAQALDLPETTVETRLARARRSLRERAEQGRRLAASPDAGLTASRLHGR